MQPEYEQQITGAKQLAAWNRIKAALDGQDRYAISEYKGYDKPLSVCCRQCGDVVTFKARQFALGGHCNNCTRKSAKAKLRAILEKQGRIWLNEDEFAGLSYSTVHYRCTICGHHGEQRSTDIVYANKGCNGNCRKEKLLAVNRANTGLRAQSWLARGQATFEKALRMQQRKMVGIYKGRKEKVLVECLLCGAVAGVFPNAVIESGVDCQSCKSLRGKKKEEPNRMIDIHMNLNMPVKLKILSPIVDELERQALEVGLATRKFCSFVIVDFITQGRALELKVSEHPLDCEREYVGSKDRGFRDLSLVFTNEELATIAERAKEMHLKISAYVVFALLSHLKSGRRMKVVFD